MYPYYLNSIEVYQRWIPCLSITSPRYNRILYVLEMLAREVKYPPPLPVMRPVFADMLFDTRIDEFVQNHS